MSIKKNQERKLAIPAIEHLRDRSLVLENNVALRNRFDCLELEVDLESMLDNFKESMSQVSIEVLGQRPWWCKGICLKKLRICHWNVGNSSGRIQTQMLTDQSILS